MFSDMFCSLQDKQNHNCNASLWSSSMENTFWSRKRATGLQKQRFFLRFKAVFRAQIEQQGLPGNMAENGVIWVKKSTSDILIREVILEVRHTEKRVFSPF